MNLKVVACRQRIIPLRLALLLALLVCTPFEGPAEQLPVRTYTTADGLPRDLILRIVRDSYGFLWFCTGDGLSRFNGYEFTTYGLEHGLANTRVNDLVETRKGVYWVATEGGISRFNPSPSRNAQSLSRSAIPNLFTAYPVGDEMMSNRVEVLHEDRDGQLWAGTDAGLFRLEETNGQAVFRRVALRDQMIVAFAEDREGGLWMSTTTGLMRRLPDGRIIRYTIQPSALGDLVTALLYDSEGRLWVGHRGGAGLVVLKPQTAAAAGSGGSTVALKLGHCGNSTDQRMRLPFAPGDVCQFTTAEGLAGDIVGGLSQSSDGRIWIATNGGLNEFSDGRFRSYSTALGLVNSTVGTLVEDSNGNLWLGGLTGATKITWSGFTSFGKTDGLGQLRITSIREDQRGDLCSISTDNDYYINCFDGSRFKAINPQFPAEIKGFGWGTNQVAFQDRAGEWWVPTSSGLARFARVTDPEQLAHARPKAVYTQQRGELPGNDIFRLFEDSRGDVWISTAGHIRNAVVRWERGTETFHLITEESGLPSFSLPTAYAEDAEGTLWLGFYDGGLARYRAGRMQVFAPSAGVPPGLIRALYFDHSARLWVATDAGGVARLDDARADHPHFVTYTSADGLASNSVSCIVEDKLGRMYFGTTRGLDRFDSETGHIRHYTRAEGLASNAVTVAFKDRQGALWFGTDLGLSRLIPGPDPRQQQPPILISGLRIAGAEQPISALGTSEMSGLVLNPSQNQLSVDFVGLDFAGGEALKYQYKLAGANEQWSAPTNQRTINYASLAPGSYRFMVQAVTADGTISPAPATIAFIILPPLWQRWWFITLALLLTGLIATVIIRNRVARLIELERVRTRIAADLHDDIGSGLSRIAILSEVARHQLGPEASVGEPLATIAGASRDLVDSMSDIVWAIDPNKDQLSDLVQRMRRFASDLFTARRIDFKFEAPGEEQALKIGADLRRQVFLIFKEAVNNVARHSGCCEAQIELRIETGSLALKIVDNGTGFDADRIFEGQGLGSMRARAKSLGANLDIMSNENEGTVIVLKVPLSARLSTRDGRGS